MESVLGLPFQWWVTILGLAYIISPLDFMPEIVLGPIGLVDDVLVLILIIASWILAGASNALYDYALANPLVGGLIVIFVILFFVVMFKRYSKKKAPVYYNQQPASGSNVTINLKEVGMGSIFSLKFKKEYGLLLFVILVIIVLKII